MAGERDLTSRIQSGEIDAQFELEGKPYFLMQKNAGKDVFYVAKAITIDRDGWYGEPDKKFLGIETNEGELILGKHLTETPTKDLHLLIQRNSQERYEVELKRIIDTLRHLAELSDHRFVSYVPHANGISETIFSRDGELLKVTPRLFKRKYDERFLL